MSILEAIIIVISVYLSVWIFVRCVLFIGHIRQIKNNKLRINSHDKIEVSYSTSKDGRIAYLNIMFYGSDNSTVSYQNICIEQPCLSYMSQKDYIRHSYNLDCFMRDLQDTAELPQERAERVLFRWSSYLGRFKYKVNY